MLHIMYVQGRSEQSQQSQSSHNSHKAVTMLLLLMPSPPEGGPPVDWPASG